MSAADQRREAPPRARRTALPEAPRPQLIVGGGGPRVARTREERRERARQIGLRLVRWENARTGGVGPDLSPEVATVGEHSAQNPEADRETVQRQREDIVETFPAGQEASAQRDPHELDPRRFAFLA